MVFLVYREGMQLPLVAMVLREASALMRTSSNYDYPAHAQRMRRSVTDIYIIIAERLSARLMIAH